MAGPVQQVIGRCGSCGNDLRAKARFCDVCGSPVGAARTVSEYKQATVLFGDVVGSMQLAEQLHPERLRDIMSELFNRTAAVVQRYQGTVDKFTGDGLMALFGAPLALEDHALRACIAAMEIQSVAEKFAAEVLRRDGVRLQIRVGLNSGEVIAGEIGSGPGRYTAVGHPVGMAQRMESAAPVGGVLCSLSTARLVEGAVHLGPVENVAIKGADAPVPARRLLAVGSGHRVLGRNEGALLGRDTELSRLQERFQAAPGCLVAIVGAPGVGKSRLIDEYSGLAADLGTQIVHARCEAHTTTVAFRALARLLRAMFTVDGVSDSVAREKVLAQCDYALGPDSADAQILFEVMGIADPAAPPLEVSVDGRRSRLVHVMSTALATGAVPTLFVLDDAHWIDAPSDDVLADFARTLDGSTSMFVTTYRPEFRGALAQQAEETITLQPLTGSAAVQLVSQLLGEDPSLAGLVQRIAVAAVGNPFFAEEIVRDLADRELISGSRGRYRLVGDVQEISVPPTVQAVLAARIDRLPAEAKAVVNAAAVIGNRFDIDTLHALLPEPVAPALTDLLTAELIDQTEFTPRQRYCFRHPLVRTVAYESQLNTTRAQVHRRLAAAIEARDPHGDENAALIATHLEAAGDLAEAYRWHVRAAEWLRPRDLPAARAQWFCARNLADRLPDDRHDIVAMRIAARTMLISTESFVGIDADGDQQYDELREMALHAGDLRSLAIATAGRIMSFTFNQTRVPEAASLASELETLLQQVDFGKGQEADIALIAVVRAYHADGQVDAALRVIDAIEARPHHEPTIEFPAGVHTFRGVIDLCRGNLESGRRHLAEGLAHARLLPPVGHAIMLSFWTLMVVLGMCEPEDMLDEMREALQRAESFGDICGIITAQFAYGTSLLRADDASRDEAIEVIEHARTSILKHGVMGTNLMPAIGADLAIDAARRGRSDEAIDDLRTLYAHHLAGGVRAEVGCLGEALVGLLIDRATAGDLTEAHRIVDEWRVRRPDVPAADMWWLKSRAMLAKAEGDATGYAELAAQYLAVCEKLDARGRLGEARRMVMAGG